MIFFISFVGYNLAVSLIRTSFGFPWRKCFRSPHKWHPALQYDISAAKSSLDSSNSEAPELSQTTAETPVTAMVREEIMAVKDLEETSETPVVSLATDEDTVEASCDAPVTSIMTSRDVSLEITETAVVSIPMTKDEEIFIMADDETTEVLEMSEMFSLASLDSPVIQKKRRRSRAKKARKMEKKKASPVHTVSPHVSQQQQIMNSGLMNFGSSCYMNSSLQCLFNAESFCSQLASQVSHWIHHPDAQLLRSFIDLYRIRESMDFERKMFLLMELMDAAAKTNRDFSVYRQNDAHEFLFHILSQMEQTGETLGLKGGVAYNCPIKTHFSFQLKSVITCTRCGNQKARVEYFNHLALALPHQGSVRDCLKLFFSAETELECKCELCNCSSANLRLMFHTLPRILVVQLKRFCFSSAFIKKQQSFVQIDPSLQLTLPVFPEHHAHKQTVTPDHVGLNMPPYGIRKAEDRNLEKNKLGQSVSRYSLVSVLNHIGSSIHYGHYLSDCSSRADSCWLSFNDESVTLMTEKQVLEKRRSSAYVLFYERVS